MRWRTARSTGSRRASSASVGFGRHFRNVARHDETAPEPVGRVERHLERRHRQHIGCEVQRFAGRLERELLPPRARGPSVPRKNLTRDFEGCSMGISSATSSPTSCPPSGVAGSGVVAQLSGEDVRERTQSSPRTETLGQKPSAICPRDDDVAQVRLAAEEIADRSSTRRATKCRPGRPLL